MDTHERIYHCLHPDCSKLKGFTSANILKRHEKQIHKMHGGVELYCPHEGCSRVEGGGHPFTRKENLTDHLQRKHNKQDKISSRANHPIALNTGMKRKRELLFTEEAEASGKSARLRATIERLERRIELLEEERFSRQFPELEE